MKPQTPEEWQSYVDSLDEDDLFRQAIAAGSVKFMTKLLDEGSPSSFVTEIQKIFALRFVEVGLEPPARSSGCVVDYRRLAGGL